MAAPTTLVSGRDILRTVRDDLAPYRAAIEPHQRRVTIIRFEATQPETDTHPDATGQPKGTPHPRRAQSPLEQGRTPSRLVR